jgi:lipoprotein-anchoring transpeptidase ErfK/SrfK
MRPAWSPPEEVRLDNPNLPDVIPGGAPNNPMGLAALTVSGGEYAIHGTNRPESIGKFASYGCIRMHNEDIADLFERVDSVRWWWSRAKPRGRVLAREASGMSP